MNAGCGFVGRPHPRHPFTTPHPMVYETVQVAPKKLSKDEIQQMKNQCLQDEGVVCSSHCMRAFVWDFEGSHTNALIQSVKFHFISKLVIKRGLELMANTVGSTFRKEEVVVLPLASSPPQILLNEGLSLKIFILDS